MACLLFFMVKPKDMKSYLFAVLSILLLPAPGSTQPWSAGIQFGEHVSSLWGESSQDYALGFLAGIHASHYLTPNWVIRAEINFDRRGTRIPPPVITDPDFATEFVLDYLSLPVMFRYATGETWRLHGGLGGSVNLLLREKTLYGSISRNETAEFRKVNADVLATGGVAYAIRDNLTFSLDLRAQSGLSEIRRSRPGVQQPLGRHILWGLLAGLNVYL